MKIIGPFRDYYDSAQAYAHDDSVVYLRKQEYATHLECDWPGASDALRLAREDERILNRYFNAIYYKSVILLFCGRAYVYWLDCARFGHLASGTSSEKLMDFQSIQPWLADLPNRKEFFYTHYVPEIEKAVKRMKPFDGTELNLATFYAFNVPSLLVSRIPEQGGGKRFEVLTNPRLQ